jgi:hypothetical protein
LNLWSTIGADNQGAEPSAQDRLEIKHTLDALAFEKRQQEERWEKEGRRWAPSEVLVVGALVVIALFASIYLVGRPW